MHKSRQLKNLFFIGIALALSAGCAPQTLPSYSDPGAGNLTTEVRRLQGALASQERSFRELSDRVAEFSDRLDQQQAEIAELSRQMTRLETTAVPPETSHALTQPDSARETGMTGAQTLPADLQGSPTDIYLRAFGDYASGRYSAAIAGFRTFLQNFPNNSYAGNAQFWMADSYFKLQQLPEAIDTFESLLRLYPHAPKAPDALLKIAAAYLQLERPELARQAIETLRRDYPSSAAAKKADELVLP